MSPFHSPETGLRGEPRIRAHQAITGSPHDIRQKGAPEGRKGPQADLQGNDVAAPQGGDRESGQSGSSTPPAAVARGFIEEPLEVRAPRD